jgi:ribonuclease HI
LFCQFARTVWRDVKQIIPLQLKRKEFTTSRLWLFEFLSRATELQATTLSIAFYLIWEARNDARNSEAKPCLSRTSGKIVAFVDFIKQHLYKEVPVQRRVSSSSGPSWSPPPSGTVVVNSDAAIFHGRRVSSAGVIIRDHDGKFLVASHHFMSGHLEPELAEALALRRAVELALEEGVCNAIFESDCLSLISRINSGLEDRSSVGIIAAGIKHLVKDFTSVSFRHVRRALNEAAHLLAKSCVNVNSSFIFHSSVPDFLRGTLCIDV